jgi:hypothetical protein
VIFRGVATRRCIEALVEKDNYVDGFIDEKKVFTVIPGKSVCIHFDNSVAGARRIDETGGGRALTSHAEA